MGIQHLKEYGLKLVENGYFIIPIKKGTKQPEPSLTGWPNIRATKEDVIKWTSNGFANSGIGVICSNVSGWDIDVYDYDVCRHMVDWTNPLCGKRMNIRWLYW